MPPSLSRWQEGDVVQYVVKGVVQRGTVIKCVGTRVRVAHEDGGGAGWVEITDVTAGQAQMVMAALEVEAQAGSATRPLSSSLHARTVPPGIAYC